MNNTNFAIICIHQKNNIHYRFSFTVKCNENSINIFLKSIFKSDKKPIGTGNKHGYFEQFFLKDILFEKITNYRSFELNTIYF